MIEGLPDLGDKLWSFIQDIIYKPKFLKTWLKSNSAISIPVDKPFKGIIQLVLENLLRISRISMCLCHDAFFTALDKSYDFISHPWPPDLFLDEGEDIIDLRVTSANGGVDRLS